jgi:D-glycero-alpha-D-manno-heptose 1-phosphate guanylyltransferase
MQAIILAGGLGTRLRSVVSDLPKPMAGVAGRPFLSWVLDRLAAQGFRRAVLAVGYRYEAIHDHFGDSHHGLPLSYSVEDSPLGTGGAIRLAAENLDAYPVFVLNGDTFVDLDYQAMRDAHDERGAAMSVAVCRVPDVSRYGALELRGGRIVGFREKGPSGPGYINAGIYILSRQVMDMIPAQGPCSFEQQILVPRIAEIRPAAFITEGLFIDIGVPEDYARAQYLFPLPAGRP